jgi:MoaA/NifB/PqqE/SkfB family radical SAM enzyme
MTARRSLITDQLAASCYFRTSVPTGQRKALVQITERCNLHCAHCFVSAGDYGDTMRTADITGLLIPRLRECRVTRVTLTGGEPFAHPDILEVVVAFRAHGFGVGICSNATIISDAQLDALRGIGQVHVNVSLDGFRTESHGRFRGNRASFATTIDPGGQLLGHAASASSRRVRWLVRVRSRACPFHQASRRIRLSATAA